MIIKLVEDSDTIGSPPVQPTDIEGGASSDAVLIRGLRANDPRVLQELMAGYWPPLVAFAQRTLAGSGDPEDVVQTAFVRLWSRRAGLKEQGSLKSLLYTIVRNACLDELRKRPDETGQRKALVHPLHPGHLMRTCTGPSYSAWQQPRCPAFLSGGGRCFAWYAKKAFRTRR